MDLPNGFTKSEEDCSKTAVKNINRTIAVLNIGVLLIVLPIDTAVACTYPTFYVNT